MALIIGVVIVLLILFGFLCYKKAPPTEAIVVTGFGLARPKVVCGKGTFVLPVLQRADRLNMRLLKIDVKTPETGVKTQNGVSLWIDSVVTIQVYSENSTVLDEEVKASGLKDAKAYIMSRQQAAISNFLGMNEQGINDKVNDVLQGNLREIVSDMTVDQILTNRKQMALSVIENARPDLAKMGLEVVTFNVQDIRDAIVMAITVALAVCAVLSLIAMVKCATANSHNKELVGSVAAKTVYRKDDSEQHMLDFFRTTIEMMQKRLAKEPQQQFLRVVDRHRGFLAPCPKGKANGGMRTYGCRDCESFICSMTCVSGGSSGVYCAYPAQANTYGDWDTDYRV